MPKCDGGGAAGGVVGFVAAAVGPTGVAAAARCLTGVVAGFAEAATGGVAFTAAADAGFAVPATAGVADAAGGEEGDVLAAAAGTAADVEPAWGCVSFEAGTDEAPVIGTLAIAGGPSAT